MKEKPMLIMMMGISGSGKSTLAEHICINNGDIDVMEAANRTGDPIIHSSDDLRAELYGDANEQSKNDDLFIELHRRIKRDLANGKSVIYDATNLNKKRRAAFLSELKNIQCEKVCVAVMTTYEACLANNAKRDRKVPDKVIKRQFFNWQPPHYNDGFDVIWFVFPQGEGYDCKQYVHDASYENLKLFDQENHNHALTLGDHCLKVYEYCKEKAPDNKMLQTAAYLHDIGKLYTKTHINKKGVDDGNAHYYQHECVGAYVAAFVLHDMDYPVNDTLDAINLIFYHMRPYMSWKDSEKAKERDAFILGKELFEDVLLLHEADVAAH